MVDGNTEPVEAGSIHIAIYCSTNNAGAYECFAIPLSDLPDVSVKYDQPTSSKFMVEMDSYFNVQLSVQCGRLG